MTHSSFTMTQPPREKNNNSSSSGSSSSGNNSSNNNSSSNNSNGNSYDPNNPFLYGIEDYEHCLAPEYRVDPLQKPWNYCYLYSEASDINGRNMGKYEKGVVVKVIEYYGGNHGKFNYCYVITQDDKLGYMHDYALQPVDNGI